MLTCRRCGTFVCAERVAADGLTCTACERRAQLAPKPGRPWLWSLAAGALPLAAFIVVGTAVSWLRPDLVQPLFDRPFGYLLIVAALFLTGVNVFATRLLLLIRRRALGVGLIVTMQLVAVSVAVFVALFAPVVFAFMFGDR